MHLSLFPRRLPLWLACGSFGLASLMAQTPGTVYRWDNPAVVVEGLNESTAPAFALDKLGNEWAMWSQTGDLPGSVKTYATWRNGPQSPWSSPTLLFASTPEVPQGQGTHSLACDGEGNAWALWTCDDDSLSSLHGAYFAKQNQSWSKTHVVANLLTPTLQLAALPNGYGAAALISERNHKSPDEAPQHHGPRLSPPPKKVLRLANLAPQAPIQLTELGEVPYCSQLLLDDNAQGQALAVRRRGSNKMYYQTCTGQKWDREVEIPEQGRLHSLTHNGRGHFVLLTEATTQLQTQIYSPDKGWSVPVPTPAKFAMEDLRFAQLGVDTLGNMHLVWAVRGEKDKHATHTYAAFFSPQKGWSAPQALGSVLDVKLMVSGAGEGMLIEAGKAFRTVKEGGQWSTPAPLPGLDNRTTLESATMNQRGQVALLLKQAYQDEEESNLCRYSVLHYR